MERAVPPRLSHPANDRVLRYLESRAAGEPLIRAPEGVVQPYLTLGTHPDCVERIWKMLNGCLPMDCRWVVYRSPVLVHPVSGVIIAFGAGTFYALRLPPPELAQALLAGAKQSHTFKALPRDSRVARTWDLRNNGPDWVFGGWKEEEKAWCLAAYQAFGAP